MREAVTARQLDVLATDVARWAASWPDIRAVALVGSYARGHPTPESDIDLVVLTTDRDAYVEHDERIQQLKLGEVIATRPWGAITERRLRRPDGLEIEVGIGGPEWAALEPIDPGIAKVVRDGLRILYDPDELLRTLIAALS